MFGYEWTIEFWVWPDCFITSLFWYDFTWFRCYNKIACTAGVDINIFRYHFVPPGFQYFQSCYIPYGYQVHFQSKEWHVLQTYIYIPQLPGTPLHMQFQAAPLNYLFGQGDWVHNDLYQCHFVPLEFQFYDLSATCSELLSTSPTPRNVHNVPLPSIQEPLLYIGWVHDH